MMCAPEGRRPSTERWEHRRHGRMCSSFSVGHPTPLRRWLVSASPDGDHLEEPAFAFPDCVPSSADIVARAPRIYDFPYIYSPLSYVSGRTICWSVRRLSHLNLHPQRWAQTLVTEGEGTDSCRLKDSQSDSGSGTCYFTLKIFDSFELIVKPSFIRCINLLWYLLLMLVIYLHDWVCLTIAK